MIITYLKLLRVKHYIKNILIFLPLFFHGEIFHTQSLIQLLFGFICFSLISSSVYIFNDIQDVEKDRQHPIKKFRPIANRVVPINYAKVVAVCLFLMAIIINLLFLNYKTFFILFLYFILNILYSVWLKHIPIIDVLILTSGFVLRVIYGALIVDVPISNWFNLTVWLGAFYLGLGKRRNEFEKHASQCNTRPVLKYYTYSFLDKNMYLSATLTCVFYSLWAVEKDNVYLVWSIPVFILIIMKYSLNIEGHSDGDPVEVILKDKIIILLLLIYAVIISTGIYLYG